MFKQIIKQSLVLYQQGQTDRALNLVLSTLKKYPDHLDILKETENYLQQQIQSAPDKPEHYINLGILQLSQNQNTAAQANFKKAIACQTDTIEACKKLANLLKEQQYYSMAEHYYGQILKYQPGALSVLFNLADIYHRQKRYQESETYYLQVLKQVPDFTEIRLNLAELYLEQGDYCKAETHYQQILSDKPQNIVACLQLANLFKRQHNDVKAEQYYRRAIQLDPERAEIYNNLGIVLENQQKSDAAENSFIQAIAIQPDLVEAHLNLGRRYAQKRQYEQAYQAYQKAQSYQPDNALVYFNLGNLFKLQQNTKRAETAFKQALSIDPSLIDAYNNLANLYFDQKNFQQATHFFQQALELAPNRADIHSNYGTLLLKQNKLQQGEEEIRHALKLQPDYLDGLNNLEALLIDKNCFKEAEAIARKIVKYYPDKAQSWNTLAIILHKQGLFRAAVNTYRQAIELDPDNLETTFNLSTLLLSCKRYKSGWRYYETRYLRKEANYLTPAITAPRWQGESLQGKQLLVYCEQGHGDEIQFIRYLPYLKKTGIKSITYVCKKPLKRLFQSAQGIDRLISFDEFVEHPQDKFDYWCFLLSLPHLLYHSLPTIPDTLPYLSLPDDVSLPGISQLTDQSKFKIGLVWQGSSHHINDKYRSLPSIDTLKPLWKYSRDIYFFSLQHNTESLDKLPVIHLGHLIHDFADTAALIAQLDLVISVDTAIVHLAGALNIACWVLLPFNPDWRWLHHRQQSPWYPEKVRLFRQKTGEDWAEVVQQLVHALNKQLRSH